MMFSAFLLIAGLVSVRISVCRTSDVRECPRFDYEYKLLERILLLEHKDVEFERKQNVLERKNEELGEALGQQRLEFEEKIGKGDNASATMKQELLQTIAEVRIESSKRNDDQDKTRETMKTSLVTQLERAISETNVNQNRARDELKNEFYRFKQEVNGRTDGQFLAFTARLTHSQKWTPGSIIKYDNILTNDDNMYNPSTGIFTVPVRGRYLISIAVTSYGHSAVVASLTQNGGEIARLEADDEDKQGDQDTGAQTIVVDLNKGDSVQVKILTATPSSSGYTLFGNKYNTITAVLLKAL